MCSRARDKTSEFPIELFCARSVLSSAALRRRFCTCVERWLRFTVCWFPIAVLMVRKIKKTARLSYEGKITWLTFVAVAPAMFIALALLWFGDHAPKVQWTLTILIVGCMGSFIWSTREHAVRPLQTLSNLLAALRARDYFSLSPGGAT